MLSLPEGFLLLPNKPGRGSGGGLCWRATRQGLEEMFTVNRLGLLPALRRCLCSTNIIESPHSGVRLRTRRLCR